MSDEDRILDIIGNSYAEKKDATLAKLLYDAPIRSENVVRIGPVFANFNCLRTFIFTPVAPHFSSEFSQFSIPLLLVRSAAKWHKKGVGGAAENASTLRHHTFGSYISLSISRLSPITLHRSLFANARTNETNNT